MSNNLMCSCGKPAQIACKCLSNLNFFCFAHLEQHMLNDPDNHIPLAISHALMMHDPESKSRSMQLDKIEMNLLNYEKELEAHIFRLSSIHNTLKESIDQIFQDYYTKYSKTLNDVKELRNKVEWYKIRDLEEATAVIEKHRSSKVRGILPSYHDISPINIVDILQSVANKFGLGIDIILQTGNIEAQESRHIYEMCLHSNESLIRLDNLNSKQISELFGINMQESSLYSNPSSSEKFPSQYQIPKIEYIQPNPVATCCICNSSHNQPKLRQLTVCNHIVHEACFLDFTTSQLSRGAFPEACPHSNCTSKLDPKDIELTIPESFKQRFQQLYTKQVPISIREANYNRGN